MYRAKQGFLFFYFFTCLWRNLSFHYCPTSCICCLHCSLVVVPTQGFHFCFFHFFFVVVFRKQHDLARRGVAKDKLVFGDVETWPYVISNLDLDPFVVSILGSNLNNTPLIVYYYYFFFFLFF